MSLPRCICRKCGKNTAARAYRGDYLNACYPFRHKLPDGSVCEGTWLEVEDLISAKKPTHQRAGDLR